ncbi:hypothetical protein [Burkholderia cepacia]|uniref:hypothetical protein n=1 Tax=Burkholderia cepacia TaxID=292 RepID=UPI000F580A94|nr:hypothetical protein [Burkholderia cepacia]
MESTESIEGAITLPDYHIFPFDYIHKTHWDLINNSYINKSRDIRYKLIQKHLGVGLTLTPDKAHAALLKVLSDMEDAFKKVISRHSCFYWIHLYRRLAPRLSPELGDEVGPMTLLWVRGIVEQAIFKFGPTQKFLDAQLATQVASKSIMGGLLVKSLAKLRNKEFAKLYVDYISKSPQWVLTNFRPSDLANAYFIEGLAYQYWYISAKLRATGKGIPIVVDADGAIRETRSAEQDQLIKSYDERIEAPESGFASNVGTFVRHSAPKIGRSVACFSHNATQIAMPALNGIEFKDLRTRGEFIPNYLLGWLDAAEYYLAHRYLEKSFRNRYGFGLREFCLAACALSFILVGLELPGQKPSGESFARNIQHKLQRGYVFTGLTVEELKKSALEFCKDPCVDTALQGSSIDDEIDRIIDFLTFTPAKQSTISLWSLGPRFLISRYREWCFYDLSAWPMIFRNLFFGLRKYDPSNKKGPEFELAFAELARSKGLSVILESTEIVLGDKDREVDVAIRVGDRLFVCECRAFERPLNFEIGNPATIGARNDDLQDKVKQVMSLAELFRKYPKGANYDVTWASAIVAIVVSPYVEWVWSMNDELWISKEKLIPRIMESGEALDFIRGHSDRHEVGQVSA